MNKRGILAEKTGFYILYIFLFTFVFLYAVSFLKVSKAEFNSDEIEDSIIATNVLNCLSTNEFGIFDENKMTMVEMRKCFDDDKYFLKIKLKKDNNEEKTLTPYGELNNYRTVNRYVNLKDGNAILEINYVKNLRRYEENAA